MAATESQTSLVVNSDAAARLFTGQCSLEDWCAGTCSVQRSPARTALFTLGILLPCAVICSAYGRILVTVGAVLHPHRVPGAAQVRRVRQRARPGARQAEEWRLSRLVATIIAAFLVCTLPGALVMETDPLAERFPVVTK